MLYYIIRTFALLVLILLFKLKIIGAKNIPKKGRLIICCNHIHFFDPIYVAGSTMRKIHFLAKKELFQSKLSKLFFKGLGAIPVNRDGNDAYSLKTSLTLLKKEKVLGIFPEGTRNKNNNTEGIVFKPGVSMLAIKTKTPIIPVHIIGSYKIFSKMTIVVGEAIHLDKYANQRLTSDDYMRIANEEIAAKLLSLNEEYAGFKR